MTDHPYDIPSGCTGAIVGKGGATINGLKSQSGVEDIKMPEKVEPRPKAREPVTLTIIGRKSAAEKAKVLIQAIVDEWVSFLPVMFSNCESILTSLCS